VIPDSGATEDENLFWRFWEHVFKYETNRNSGWIHLNKPSRFHQSNRVSAIGVLAPLRLIDIVSGIEARSDGTLMSGQLLLTLDNQVNILGGTLEQIDATIINNIVAIYANNTSRPVMVSSVILHVTFQLNLPGVAVTANSAALVTIGTQEGNYRDIVGTLDPDTTTQQGVSTRLHGLNQVKELFPDDREAAPLIMPNQTVYLRVDTPAGSPIQAQVLIARVKGHAL
jgi:hypothetical protein